MGALLSVLIGLGTFVGLTRRKRGIVAVPVNGPALPGETKPHRNVMSAELTSSPGPGVKTATDIIKFAETYGDRHLIGSRRLVKTHTEEKTLISKDGKEQVKKWTYYEMSKYEWITAGQFGTIVAEIGSGIHSLRYKPGDICILFAGTSADWLSVALGNWHQGLTISTAYDTLGVAGLAYAVNETEAKLLFTNGELLPTVEKAIAQAPTLETVFYNGELESGIVDRFAKTLPHIRLFSLDQLRAKGRDRMQESANPDPDSTACIMYTSGSTGNPKGVVITHANIVAAISGAVHILDNVCKRDGTDCFLAMLPQAHILEMTVEMTCLAYGVRLGYGSPRTLLNTSCRNCEGDLSALKPTIMAGVPAVWDGIRKAIMSTTSKLPPTAKKVFDVAFQLKWFLMENGLPGVGVLDAAVFNKIKAQFGGNLVAALVGGAPLSADAQKFIAVTLCPLISGYGSTECTGVIAVETPIINGAPLLGSTGQVLTCSEVKLVNVPDSQYSVDNKPYPEGEIWVRGGNVTKGYYKQAKKTAEAFTDDGWFMTGDVGKFDELGNLYVVSRLSSLVKMFNGEYIAREALESFFSLSRLVDRILVYGDSEHNQVVAVVVPKLDTMREWAVSQGLLSLDASLDEIAKSKECTREVLRELVAIAKGHGLARAETPVGVVLSREEWTPQNNRLTAAQKIKRRELEAEFKDEILRVYG